LALPSVFSTSMPVEVVSAGGILVRQVDTNGQALDDNTDMYSVALPVMPVSSVGINEDGTRTFGTWTKITISPEGFPVVRVDSAGNASSIALGSVSPAPVNIVAPVITGSGLVGQTLLTSNGTWLYVPSSYTHQWKRDGVDIAGETGTTYLLVSGDVGKNITCVTTATNSTGSTPATSNSIGPIASAGALSSTNAVQTNPAGTAPFTFSVIMGSDIYPGFYLDIERSNASTVNGSGNYTTTTLVLSHQITEQDRTDSYVTTASLSADTLHTTSFWYYLLRALSLET
jgi:hypothetical protein